jgi:putative membrane protein
MLGQLAQLVQFDGLDAATRNFGYGMRGVRPGLAGFGLAFPLGAIICGLVFAGLVAAVIVLAVRLSRRGRTTSEAVEILKARYARGEISKNDFETMRKDLS